MQGALLSAGVLSLIASTAALCDAARRVALRFWAGAPLAALTATVLVAVSLIVLVLEAVGLLGFLGPIPVLAVSLATWAGVAYFLRTPPAQASITEKSRRWRLTPPRTVNQLVAWSAIGAMTILVTASLVNAVLGPGPEFDAVATHLPLAVSWLQTGTIASFPYQTPLSWQAHYPGNSELIALWLMIPVGRDFLVQLASLPAVAMTVLGVGLGARELGARRLTAVAAALLVPTLPLILVDQVGTNMEDLHLVGALATMAAFIALHRRSPRRANIAAAGLAAGYAIGSRYAGLIAVLPLTALLFWQVAAPRASLRSVTRSVFVFGSLMVLGGGYWYLRNLVYTGDPVYPQSLPWHHVTATEQLGLATLRSYVQAGWRPLDWLVAAGDVFAYYGPIFLMLAAGGLALPALALLRRRRFQFGWAWTLLPILEFAGFLILPASAGQVVNGHLDRFLNIVNVRYLVPALAISAIVLAAAMAELPAEIEATLVAVVLLVAAAASVGLALEHPPIPGRALNLTSLALAALVLVLAAVAARALAGRSRRALAGLGVVVVAALLAPSIAAHYDGQRLAVNLPFEDARVHLSADDQVIDVVGICRLYALYGPDLNRRVEYLTGADDRIDRPLATTYEEWLASLRRERVTAVVSGSDLCYSSVDVPQVQWMADHPDVFVQTYENAGSRVYRVRLDG